MLCCVSIESVFPYFSVTFHTLRLLIENEAITAFILMQIAWLHFSRYSNPFGRFNSTFSELQWRFNNFIFRNIHNSLGKCHIHWVKVSVRHAHSMGSLVITLEIQWGKLLEVFRKWVLLEKHTYGFPIPNISNGLVLDQFRRFNFEWCKFLPHLNPCITPMKHVSTSLSDYPCWYLQNICRGNKA